jgi:hypothetical protein
MEQIVSKKVQGTAGNNRSDYWGSTAQELAFLGQIGAATDSFNSFVNLGFLAGDHRYDGYRAGAKAVQLAAIGRKDEALAEVARMLSFPNLYLWSVTVLRHFLSWRALQGDPRFEALLNDPKNNEPLF